MYSLDASLFTRALRRECVERIPFWDVLYGLPANLAGALLGRELDAGQDRVGQLSDYAPEDQLALARRLGVDVIGFRAGWGFGGDVWVTDERGVRRYVDGRIKRRADITELPPLDVGATYRKVERFLAATEGTGAGVYVGLHGIFHDVIQSVGYGDFMLALHDDPGFVETLLDISLEHNVQLVEGLAAYPLTFLRFYEDIAYNRGLMLRPEVFKRLWLPRVVRLVAPARAAGLPVTLHCCGRLDQMLPLAIEAGFAAIDPIEPGCNDIYALHARYGELICFMGNIGIDLLTDGPPERIAAAVREQVGRLGSRGGYVIKTGNHFNEQVPAAHVLALAQAARGCAHDMH